MIQGDSTITVVVVIIIIIIIIGCIKAQDYTSSTRNTNTSLRILPSDVKIFYVIYPQNKHLRKQEFLYLTHYKNENVTGHVQL